MSHLPTRVSSHDMLQGSNVDRDSQNFVVCPSYLMLQVFQPCISLHIIHGSQIQKCCSWYPRDARHTLACQRAYSLSKTPSRFYEKHEILYYSYMDKIHFST